MALLLAFVLALIPLLIAPGPLFYFDVTPKIALLLLGTAAAVLWWAAGGASGFPKASREARWFVLVISGMAASLAIATLASVNRGLSVGGSDWRRWGLVTQLAALALTYLAADCCAGRPERARVILRAVAASGLITALYGIGQYLGWDPLLDPKAYHVGEGVWTIVRPPATLGHADYFANWLLAVVFAGAALRGETALTWKCVVWAAVAAGCVAILLSGTRAALLGLVAGALFLAIWQGLRFTRRRAMTAGALALLAALFYLSPAGTQLRARVHWSREDSAGGARLLLWRDSLRMVAPRGPVGYGPETFTGSFARWQSPDLARAYPDFYQESPHNIFLDVLVGQGAEGLLLLLALCGVGFAAAWRLRRSPNHGVAGALAASLAAMTVSGQFASFTLSTALPYYVTTALLVSLTVPTAPAQHPVGRRWPVFAAVVPFAGVLVVFAARLLVADSALAAVRRDLDAGHVEPAAREYARYQAWRWPGGAADEWYSRRLFQVATSAADPRVYNLAWKQAAQAAGRATGTAEDPFNAYYNLAAFWASQNDFPRTEQSLRLAVSQAPNWFKPHWMLAQVLEAAARLPEANGEAAKAVELDGGKHPEVTRTLEHIRARLDGAPPAPDKK